MEGEIEGTEVVGWKEGSRRAQEEERGTDKGRKG